MFFVYLFIKQTLVNNNDVEYCKSSKKNQVKVKIRKQGRKLKINAVGPS